MHRGDILDEAIRLVEGARAEAYGDALVTHQNIAGLWSVFLGVPITAQQVALMMALLKIARTMQGPPNPDNFIDMVGYGALAGEMAT